MRSRGEAAALRLADVWCVRIEWGILELMTRFNTRPACVALLIGGLAPFLAGCDEPNLAAASATQISEPEVSIVTVAPRARAVVRELPGRIAPTRVADVRPRASGIVVERSFNQGSEVKAGDTLYRIDPRPFEVDLQSNEAALARATAVYDQAAQQARRVALLASQHATTEVENEKATAAMRQAEADVAGRKADVSRARLNLDYATIRAPIDGIVGAALVSEGALVVQNDAATLATIQQLDPIYADFTQSVGELNHLRRAFEAGDLDRIAPGAAKIRLVLDDGTPYAVAGKLLFSEAKVDAHTGQVTLRGEFPNPKRELLPGMYVRVLIEQGIDTDAIAVPQQAIQRNGGGGSEVFVVKDDNRIATQAVRTGSVQDGVWFVTDGLKSGDRVVVEGFQKFAAGDKVRPQAWTEGDAQADGAPDAHPTMQARR
jgi:membrane fusion protein (multidrug efflux system)